MCGHSQIQHRCVWPRCGARVWLVGNSAVHGAIRAVLSHVSTPLVVRSAVGDCLAHCTYCSTCMVHSTCLRIIILRVCGCTRECEGRHSFAHLSDMFDRRAVRPSVRPATQSSLVKCHPPTYMHLFIYALFPTDMTGRPTAPSFSMPSLWPPAKGARTRRSFQRAW